MAEWVRWMVGLEGCQVGGWLVRVWWVAAEVSRWLGVWVSEWSGADLGRGCLQTSIKT